jgi:uncharacterized protein YjaG (DUF416 family)
MDLFKSTVCNKVHPNHFLKVTKAIIQGKKLNRIIIKLVSKILTLKKNKPAINKKRYYNPVKIY